MIRDESLLFLGACILASSGNRSFAAAAIGAEEIATHIRLMALAEAEGQENAPLADVKSLRAQQIRDTLNAVNGNISAAARVLGMPRTTVDSIIRPRKARAAGA
jgi:ActR/RegA family two-component response regulator